MSETKVALGLLRQFKVSRRSTTGLVYLDDSEVDLLEFAIIAERADAEAKAEALEKKVEARIAELEAEVEAWKSASGLTCGGDPDGVTPDAMRIYWEGVEDERDEARAHWDLTAAQLSMVGSELCGDGKIDPNDHRDLRWTPTLKQAGKVMGELANLVAERADLRERLQRVEAERDEAQGRVIGCGYCGKTVFEYPSGAPTDKDHALALEVFQKHDERCPFNPVARRLREVKNEVAELLEKLTECEAALESERLQHDETRGYRQRAERELEARRACDADVMTVAESVMYETVGGESCPERLSSEANAARRILAAGFLKETP